MDIRDQSWHKILCDLLFEAQLPCLQNVNITCPPVGNVFCYLYTRQILLFLYANLCHFGSIFPVSKRVLPTRLCYSSLQIIICLQVVMFVKFCILGGGAHSHVSSELLCLTLWLACSRLSINACQVDESECLSKCFENHRNATQS